MEVKQGGGALDICGDIVDDVATTFRGWGTRLPGGCRFARDVGNGIRLVGFCGRSPGAGAVGSRPAGAAGVFGSMERVAAETDTLPPGAVVPAMTLGGGPDDTRFLEAATAAATTGWA